MFIVSQNELVSVIIPTYNRANLILQAVKSVLNQTYKNFEIIIVDDGSSDNTEDVINVIHDNRIRYIKHAINKGASAARNTGIREAKGKYIAFQDSDDHWLPDKLEKQVKRIENTPDHVGAVFGGYWIIGKGNEKRYFPEQVIKDGNIFHTLLKGNVVGMPVVMIKKICFDKVGYFNETLPALEDWELLLRISRDYEFLYINEPLVTVYETENSISMHMENTVKAWKYIFDKYLDIISADHTTLALHYYTLGKYLIRSGNFSGGRKLIFKAVKTNPRNYKYLIESSMLMLGRRVYFSQFLWKEINKINRWRKSKS
ncbi:glycosyltransferase family 2 protein [Caldifermentibacillus hisashii]|uniref:glycosyltransferase family 2 protein n=1 Tax=Caldifermentibacillus hisashii TaxID=996558 RepID=UPI003D2426A7